MESAVEEEKGRFGWGTIGFLFGLLSWVWYTEINGVVIIDKIFQFFGYINKPVQIGCVLIVAIPGALLSFLHKNNIGAQFGKAINIFSIVLGVGRLGQCLFYIYVLHMQV